MKIKTTEKLKSLKGEKLTNADGEEISLGNALATILLSDKSGDKMKNYVLANKLYNDKEVDLDESDFKKVQKACEDTQVYGAIVSGQILVMLENYKK